jgi:NADH-quinone oxidoreductase subunit N
MGKLFVFLGLVDHGYWGALSCAVIAAAAGFYYYFKTILAMYTTEGADAPALTLWPATKAVAGSPRRSPFSSSASIPSPCRRC